MASCFSAGQDASIDMHIDLLRSSVDFTITQGHLRSIFDLALSGSLKFRFFRLEKHCGVRIVTLTFFVRKLFTKNDMTETTIDLRGQ